MKKIHLGITALAVVICLTSANSVFAASNKISQNDCNITFSIENEDFSSAFDDNTGSRLYCEGGNNSYGFVFEFKEPVTLGGVEYVPYAASETGTIGEAGIYASDDGETYYQVGKFVAESAVKTTKCMLQNPVKAKYIKFWTSKTVQGMLSVAELRLIESNGEPMELETAEKKLNETAYYDIKQNIRVVASSSESGNGVGNLADTAENTFWHSRFNPQRDFPPFTIVFDLGSIQDISGLSYLPRQDSYANGRFQNCDIMISEDDVEYTTVAVTDWENNYLRKRVYFETVSARYVKVIVNKTFDDYAIAADLTVLQSEQSFLARRRKDYIKYELKIGQDFLTEQKGSSVTQHQISTSPVIVNDNTMIPLRGIAEVMGYVVGWNGHDMTVTLEKKGCKIKMQIDDDRLYMNNIRYNLDEPPIIIDDTTMIPIRLFSELSGYDVRWDSETQTVSVGNDLTLEWQ